MAGLIFKNYTVSEMSYEKNSKFQNLGTANLNTEFKCDIYINGESAMVKLSCLVGDREDSDSPFSVLVCLDGEFEFNESESDDLSFEGFLKTSAIAIMFPYMRALIGDLTARSNEFPSVHLPVINVSKMLQDQNTINITKK